MKDCRAVYQVSTPAKRVYVTTNRDEKYFDGQYPLVGYCANILNNTLFITFPYIPKYNLKPMLVCKWNYSNKSTSEADKYINTVENLDLTVCCSHYAKKIWIQKTQKRQLLQTAEKIR